MVHGQVEFTPDEVEALLGQEPAAPAAAQRPAPKRSLPRRIADAVASWSPLSGRF